MGQYYLPISLDKKEWMYSHDYDNGLKLMEHSYLKNNFVQTVETLLMPQGSWHKTRIVWAGDYADDIHLLNDIDLAVKDLSDALEDKIEEDSKINLNQLCKEDGRTDGVPDKYKPFICNKIKPDEKSVPDSFRYIVNYSKSAFIDKTKVPEYGDGYQIHPLPLMTCQGNGQGGGDYHAQGEGEENIVGSWAGDIIGIEEKVPEGFTEYEFDLTE